MSVAPSSGIVTSVHSGLLTVRELARSGRIGAALEALDALPTDELAARPTDRVLAGALRVECLLARGDLGIALEVASDLAPWVESDGLAGAIARYSTADVSAALGEPERAAERFASADNGVDPVFVPWRNAAALVLLQLGRRREAVALAREQVVIATSGSAYDVAAALRVLATAEADGGGIARLRQALDLVEGLGADRLRATIAVDLAGLLALAGTTDDAAEAVTLLRNAESYAAREELMPLQGRVRRLLERLGETPRRREAEALATLTAAERRVTVLALDGLTNRQIADRLEVSVKAVEGHLSKVYRKLGVTSRTAMAACLRESA